MATPQVPTPEKMDMSGDQRENWAFFKLTWRNYATATQIHKLPPDIQVGTLFSLLGKECLKTYYNLPMEGEDTDTDSILKKLTDHFEPKQNTTYERYIFNTCSQEPGEKFADYLNRLRTLIKTCDYKSLQDELLRDCIITGMINSNTREKLLNENELTLKKAIEICRTAEQTAMQLEKLNEKLKEAELVNYTKADRRKPTQRYSTQEHRHRPPPQREMLLDCKYCGRDHEKGRCQAYRQTCTNCGKRNHLARVCQSQHSHPQPPTRTTHRKAHRTVKVRYIEADSASDESIYSLGSLLDRKQYYTDIQISTPGDDTHHSVKFQIDTGATCSTLALKDYNQISMAPLQPSHTKLRLYDNSVLQPVGMVTLRCEVNGISKKVRFQVVDNMVPSLLSGRASAALKLISFNEECVRHVRESQPEPLTKDHILDTYKDVFAGLGKLPGEYTIEVDENVKPVQNNPRRVPLPLKDELKAKLDELVEQQVITWVTQPTAWINNLVVVRKPNKLRLCIDPYHLNKAIKRNHYPTPTVEEIATKMKKARLFSVLDAKDGFLQVALDEQSSFLTTCWTPFGRIRWLRMPFGISSAPEEWQRRLDQCFEGLENIQVIADDTILYGTGDSDEEAEKSHDAALTALLERCRREGLKLNPVKLKFKQTSVNYMGHTFSAQGLAADPEKVKAISDMEQPTDVQGVQRLLGVANYLSKFTPKLSTVCEPLRRLLDKEAAFDWLPQHEAAFTQIKQLITEAPVLHYYDGSKEVTLECDSSDVGLGAVLTQEGHPVAYASRALTRTERNYAQIEKECLAMVFAAERFEQYILGKENVKVLTDHKPLQTIFSKPIHTSPKRLQRMQLKLQKYSLDVEYKPGPQMHISDTLSRASLPLPQPNTGGAGENFTPKLSTVCEPLRRLLDKEAAFDWLPQHEAAFTQIKQLITEAPVLHYYDGSKEVTLECDSSDVGLGAVLTQEGHPVAYASRALTRTERNYAQIEKECLAMVFAAERFEQYILGKENVKVLTDHKPLQTIFSKPIHTSPKRLQRMQLKLQKYSLDVEYKPGPQMHISDTLSRASLPLPQPNTGGAGENFTIFQVQEQELADEIADIRMEDYLFVTDQRLEQIRKETSRDTVLPALMDTIKAGWPSDKNKCPPNIREYWPYRDELSTQKGLAYRGMRLIIPTVLRSEMVTRAHRSHLGIQYTLNTAREIMYWPRMHADITETVRRCEICQQTQPQQQKQPLMTHPIPTHPWQCVASDCFEINSRHFVVLVDIYSDFVEIGQLPDLSSSSLIKVIKPIFATHGAPAVLITDNATNYTGIDFRKFMESWEIQHHTSSPHHHQSNGRAEAAVKLMKGIIKKTAKEGKDMWKAILEWRNATTPGMRSSPAERFFSRRTRSMLPCKTANYSPQIQMDTQQALIKKRQVAKKYHDRSSKPLPDLIIGQPVRVKCHPQTPHSDWRPGNIIAQAAPRSYTVQVNGQLYRRNRIHLRPSNTPPVTDCITNHPEQTMTTLCQPPPTSTTLEAPNPLPQPNPASATAPCEPPHCRSTRATTRPQVRRSTRIVKLPARLKDCAL